MEKSEKIPAKDLSKGFYVDLYCCMCGEEQTIAGDSIEECLEKIEEAEWTDLDSDDYQITGHWCGCDYLFESARAEHLM